MTPEEYFKKWSENCRIFTNYKPIHSHEDMMNFAKAYHAEQCAINGVVKPFYCDEEWDFNKKCDNQCDKCKKYNIDGSKR